MEWDLTKPQISVTINGHPYIQSGKAKTLHINKFGGGGWVGRGWCNSHNHEENVLGYALEENVLR